VRRAVDEIFKPEIVVDERVRKLAFAQGRFRGLCGQSVKVLGNLTYSSCTQVCAYSWLGSCIFLENLQDEH